MNADRAMRGRLVLAAALLAIGLGGSAFAANDWLVYVGTYTGGRTGSEGIYLFRLQTTGLEVSQNITLVPLGLAAATPSPSFLALDAKRRLLFAVNEISQFEGDRAGSVTSFRIERDGKLTELSRRSSRGAGPCHLALDPAGTHVVVANYNDGSVSALPIDDDGKLGEATDVVHHRGKSVNPQRQEGPHAHCVTFDPAGKIALVCDLGLDQVLAYDYDAVAGKLAPHDPPFTATKPGAGPRHMAFRPDGKFAYVINELDSTITAYAYDAERGALRDVQTISTLPPYYDGPNSTAEIAVHPSGKFLYGSNRGNETVVLFEIDKDSGELTYVDEQYTGGKTPRNFCIQPTGKHLVVANQGTNTLLACRIEAENGRLLPSGVYADAPSPVCVVFLPPGGDDKQ
jgi:6-phosphogluconolactonase